MLVSSIPPLSLINPQATTSKKSGSIKFSRNKVEWYTDWEKVLKELKAVQGDDVSVAVYPYGKIQFDSAKSPLSI